MIYCMADIHGEYEKYERLLKTIDLRESDKLYVLGDVLDCGATFGGRLAAIRLDDDRHFYA